MASSNDPSSLYLNSTVKELADSSIHGAYSLPSLYISRSLALAESDSFSKAEIPTVDFSRLRNGSLDERQRFISDVGRACKDWGCFTVVNHGLPESLQMAMMGAFAAFFDLPEQEKEVYKMKSVFDPICHGTSTNVMGSNVRFWRDFLRFLVYPEFHCPTKPMDFRKLSEEYARRTREICKEIMRAILESLELDESFMEEFLQFSSCRQFLVGNLYPPCTQAELVMGLPSHSDPAFFTLLMQNSSFNGLQVLHQGKWVVVDLIPQSFLLLVGDIIEIVSNGRYKSIVHRAMVSNKSTRITIGVPLTPPVESIISPSPKLIESSDSPTNLRGITFKELIALKFQDKGKNSAMDLIRM